jgi:hypothetical protein
MVPLSILKQCIEQLDYSGVRMPSFTASKFRRAAAPPVSPPAFLDRAGRNFAHVVASAGAQTQRIASSFRRALRFLPLAP